MMCDCDKEIGTKFLSHQLHEATDLKSQCRIDVTKGFVRGTCNECRGVKPEAYPVAEIYGRSSKIHRYYWREISFETMKRFASSVVNCPDSEIVTVMASNQKLSKQIEKEVVKDIKQLHKTSPKYSYTQESAADVIEKFNVDIINLKGNYVQTTERKVTIEKDGSFYSAESFAEDHLNNEGYKVLHSESIPFHVLFGVFMWNLIQDNADEQCRMVGFGDRFAFESNIEGQQVWTLLPEDYGTPKYYLRRKSKVEEHFESFPNDTDGLIRLFNFWVEPSSNFRQYLWAHKEEHIEKARKILNILPVKVLINILKYLVIDYWGHYLGWPDIIALKNKNIEFFEVKSSKDKLSEDQKTWIKGNSECLKLPFSIIKIHKNNV